MASSIHIASGHAGSVTHNSRETTTKNSIFSDEKNECSHSSKEAFNIYRNELNIRSQAYSKNTNQTLQKKAITHLSAVVNLEQRHTLEDLKPLVKHLETTLDTKVFQVAIHRDEGHINSDMKDVKNYHAHIEFLGLDSQGSSVRKKLTKKYLSDLQTQTAKLLGMQRGKNYAEEKSPRPKRLDTYEYKDYKQREAKEIKSKVATIAELKETIKELRAELKENKATRADYASLEQLSKELKSKVESKDLTIQELQASRNKYIQALKKISPESKNEVQAMEYVEKIQNQLINARKTILEQKTTIDTQKERLIVLKRNMSVLEQNFSTAETEAGRLETLLPENSSEAKQSLFSRFKNFISSLKTQIKTLKDEVLVLKKENEELRKSGKMELFLISFNQEVKERFKHWTDIEMYKRNEYQQEKAGFEYPEEQEAIIKSHYRQLIQERDQEKPYVLTREELRRDDEMAQQRLRQKQDLGYSR